MQDHLNPHSKPLPTPEQQAILDRIERAARLFDTSIGLPGGFKIGIDGLVGLIPGIGDIIMGISSAYIVREANKLNLPKGTISRMVLNIIIDSGVGLIPLAGDIFDFFFKANTKNVNLAREAFGMAPLDFQKPEKPQPREARAH